MKVDIIKKFKWYIVGFILVAIMLSVSLSFCTWDTLSLQAKLENSGSGSFKDMYKLVHDPDNNRLADVGDVVEYGNYYQNLTASGGIAAKTPLRWIVINKLNDEITLMSEKILAYGSMWGTYYADTEGKEVFGVTDSVNGNSYANYSVSTMRAWLNSNYTLRNDGGTDFSSTGEVRFRGFLSEAFTLAEQNNIVDKTISGMTGGGYNNDNTKQTFATIIDKVWTLSYSEIYGNNTLSWGSFADDGQPNKQFDYFKNTDESVFKNRIIGKTTAFASSKHSNYTYKDATPHPLNYHNTKEGDLAMWRLRTPHIERVQMNYMINEGTLWVGSSYVGYVGIRPAIILPY